MGGKTLFMHPCIVHSWFSVQNKQWGEGKIDCTARDYLRVAAAQLAEGVVPLVAQPLPVPVCDGPDGPEDAPEDGRDARSRGHPESDPEIEPQQRIFLFVLH